MPTCINPPDPEHLLVREPEWDPIAKDMKPIYTAPTAARDWNEEFATAFTNRTRTAEEQQK